MNKGKAIVRLLTILITISLVVPFTATSAFAVESQFSDADRALLLERINELRDQGMHADEEPGISLNADTITVDADNVTSGQEDITGQPNYQLTLRSNGEELNEGIRWYCFTAYPNAVYTPSEAAAAYEENEVNPDFKHENNIAALVSDTGYVTGKVSRGAVIVIAEYNEHLYACVVNVRDGNQTRKGFAEKKTAEIIREKGIDKLPTRAEKVLAVHDFLAASVEYDLHYQDCAFEYEALFHQKAVCRGYARTFKMFMNQLSIPCEYVQGDQDGTKHAWDIVKMDDGKWYYVDVTQDRQEDAFKNVVVSHRKFLQNRRTFAAWNYQLGTEDGRDENGTEFLCYPYKKADAFAETDVEIQRIVNFKLNTAAANGNNTIRFDIAVPKEKKATPKEAVKAWQTDATVKDSYTDMGDYWLANCEVENIKSFDTTTVHEFAAAEDITENGASTSTIKLSFSDAISNLTKEDLCVTGAEISGFSKTNDNTYILTVRNVSVKDGDHLSIALAKDHCQFAPQSRTVTVHTEKMATPNVVATAIDDKKVVFSNFDNTMQYSTGDDDWTRFPESEQTLTIEPRYPYTILVKSFSKDAEALPSDVQTIAFNKPNRPEAKVKNYEKTGTIYGTTPAMEYRSKNESDWISCTSNVIEGLCAGNYYLRTKAVERNLASESQLLTIEPTEPDPPIDPDLPGGTEETSYRANCTLSGSDTIAASLSQATAAKMLSDAPEVITIDATLHGEAATTIKEIHMKMSVALLKTILNNTSSTMLVKTDLGNIRVSRSMLKNLVPNRTAGNLTFVIKKEYSGSYMKYRFEIRSEKSVISAYGGATAHVTVTLDSKLKGYSSLRCLMVSSNGKYTRLSNTSKSGSLFTFRATRSTTYLIATTAKANSIMKKQADDTAKSQMKSMRLHLNARKIGSAIKLTWTKSNSCKPTSYQVYRSAKKNSGYRKIATTKKMYFRNSKGLKNGKTYYYKIRGVKKIAGKTVYTPYSAKAKVKR